MDSELRIESVSAVHDVSIAESPPNIHIMFAAFWQRMNETGKDSSRDF